MIILLLVAAISGVHAQSWSESYDTAMKALKAGSWTEARAEFQKAVASRPEDFSGPTSLPGPVTDPKRWRNGAPYSPNFGAAYAGYRAAIANNDVAASKELLGVVGREFESLLEKGQNSRETFYFLGQIYGLTRDVEKAQKLEERLKALEGKLPWKVDVELLTPEENAAIISAGTANSGGATGMETRPIATNQGTGTVPNTNPSTLAGRVQAIGTKYALIIGNSESRIPDGGIPFAATDGMLVREALVQNAGYPEANIDMVQNGTAAQITASAQALADRLPEGATVLIYFTGNGFNLDGKDFLAGIDTELTTDASTMVSKSDLYKTFMNKGAKIFAFFQVNRAVNSGRYFGQEIPMVGTIAQCQATIPGEPILSLMSGGQPTGLFTKAFAAVLADFRSNRIPITEFGWQVFYRIRRGDTGDFGGSSSQTPTLPVLTNMASDARF